MPNATRLHDHPIILMPGMAHVHAHHYLSRHAASMLAWSSRGCLIAIRSSHPHLEHGLPSMRLVGRHGRDAHVGHKADGAQRLSAEAERADCLQILKLTQFRGRVPVA